MPPVFLHYHPPSLLLPLSLYSPVLWEPLRKSFSVVGLYPTGGSYQPAAALRRFSSEWPQTLRCPTQACLVTSKTPKTSGFSEFPVCQSYLRLVWSLYFATVIVPNAIKKKIGIPLFHFRSSAFTVWFSGHFKGIRRTRQSPNFLSGLFIL